MSTKKDDTDIQFFSEFDFTKKGTMASDFPPWYFDQLIDELKSSVEHREFMLQHELVPKQELDVHKAALKNERERLSRILESVPKLNGKQIDMVVGIQRSLGKKIAEAMFSYSDMERGTADAHEEARRMTEPCIQVEGGEAKLCQSMGISPVRGRITRTDAERVWKITRKFIGENTNVETLRRSD